MYIKKLESLLKQNEGTKLDFKYKLDITQDSGKKEFAKDVCAIANSRGGRGYIIVGIEDKTRQVVGVDKEDIFKEEQLQQIISSRCEPPIPIKVEFVEYKKKIIGVVTIYDGGQRPYQIRESGAFFIRRGSTTDVMRKGELISSFEESLSFIIETSPMLKSKISYLDMELVKKYFSKKGINLTDENKSYLMESAGIIFKERGSNEEVCTFGGLLVFSNINNILIPNNMIRIINKVNNTKQEVKVIQGSLLNIILEAQSVIDDIVPIEYPKEGIFESIKNAVLYRSYTEINRMIEVIITEKSISIISPGELIQESENGTKVNLVRRNMWIYEKLITLDDNNIFLNNGRGFSRIKKSSKLLGRAKFINNPRENSFKVILPGIKTNKNI